MSIPRPAVCHTAGRQVLRGVTAQQALVDMEEQRSDQRCCMLATPPMALLGADCWVRRSVFRAAKGFAGCPEAGPYSQPRLSAAGKAHPCATSTLTFGTAWAGSHIADASLCRTAIETVNSQLEKMGLQRLGAFTCDNAARQSQGFSKCDSGECLSWISADPHCIYIHVRNEDM